MQNADSRNSGKSNGHSNRLDDLLYTRFGAGKGDYCLRKAEKRPREADGIVPELCGHSAMTALFSEENARELVRRCGAVACLAKADDVRPDATPIFHLSEAAAPLHRCVLQVVFSTAQLPGSLRWPGL